MKAFIVIAVIVVIALVSLFVFKLNSHTTQPKEGPSFMPQESKEPGLPEIRQASVTIYGSSFEPASLIIPKGTKVIWFNNDEYEHTITSANGKFDSVLLQGGQQFEYTFVQAGEYGYHCSGHPYVKGTIIVQ